MVMHTSFIPTAIYCFIILNAWFGKFILLPIKWFFGIGQEHKNPIKLTVALCGCLVAIFALLYYATGVLEEHIKLQEKRNTEAHYRSLDYL
jgi:hypothetical protein